MNEWKFARLSEVTHTTDYVANGSFESLRSNVTYRDSPDYAVLVRLVDHNASWNGPFVYVDQASFDFLRKTALAPGDIIIANVGANAGTVFRVPDIGTRTTLGPNAILCRPKPDGPLNRDFLYYYFVSAAGQQSLTSILSGSAQPKFNKTDLRSLLVPIPPIQDQLAIAAILGELDDKIEANRNMSATLDALSRALFKSWFVDFDPVRANAEARTPGLSKEVAGLFPDSFEDSELGPIPHGWRVKPIAETIIRLGVGKKYDQKTVDVKGDVPVLDQGRNGVIGFHSEAPGVVATPENPVAVFANHTCYMRLVDFPFSTIQNVLPFVGNQVGTIWAYYATVDRQQFIEYKGHWPDFILHKLVLPKTVVCDAFIDYVKPMVARMSLARIESETLSGLRGALLPRLISGELKVTDAERILAASA